MSTGAAAANGIISIHAPREGSDIDLGQGLHLVGTISIHAPREGSDRTGEVLTALVSPFLSTLPARGATTPSEKTNW